MPCTPDLTITRFFESQGVLNHAKMKNIYLLLGLICCYTMSFAHTVPICYKTQCVQINLETLAVNAKNGIALSAPQNFKPIKNIVYKLDHLKFERDNLKVTVNMTNKGLMIHFIPMMKLNKNQQIQIIFPVINKGDHFLLPMLEGRNIPTNDSRWIKFLTQHFGKQDPLSGTSGLSMQFISTIHKKIAIVYLIQNPFNNHFYFVKNKQLTLTFYHNFNRLNQNKAFGFNIRFTKATPTKIADIYRRYQINRGKFVTLQAKSMIAPEVTKLYGAPFIYLWGHELIGRSNVNWHAFHAFLKKRLALNTNNPSHWFDQLSHSAATKLYIIDPDAVNALHKLAKSKWPYASLESSVDTMFAALVQKTNLWNPKVFTKTQLNTQARELIAKGLDHLTPYEHILLNKNLLQSAYRGYIKPVNEWGNGVSLWMLRKLKGIGLKHAWLGLEDRDIGIIHRNVIEQAVKDGYLIAPYDSYWSLQKEGRNSWSTAIFQNKNLYTQGAVIKQNGKFLDGFLGRGHALNPKFSMPEEKYRLTQTLKFYKVPFNSWFFDTDGAGDLHDDFSPNHLTTQAQDAQYRIKRMNYAATHYRLVVGTEDGKDYIATVAVFGHGIVGQGIWLPSMRRDKVSKYYIGGYWSAFGIPPRYIKETPLMPIVHYIYYNPKFEIPLYQLVYNDSIIVSDHWEYGTLKFPEASHFSVLRTFLYNSPPMLHLDRKAWKHYKSFLKRYLPIWSKWHHRLVQTRMINFNYLSKDKLLQKTTFSDGTQIIVNFSHKMKTYHKFSIHANSAIIVEKQHIVEQFVS